MKGYEVLEKIEKREIKEGTKLKIKGFNREIIYKGNDFIRFIEKDKEHGEVEAYWFINTEVEIIEENKEIEELEISENDRKFHSDYINNIADKLNEVINKLNKESEEK